MMRCDQCKKCVQVNIKRVEDIGGMFEIPDRFECRAKSPIILYDEAAWPTIEPDDFCWEFEQGNPVVHPCLSDIVDQAGG